MLVKNPDGTVDDFAVENATVHLEQMDDASFMLLVQEPGKEQWYFLIKSRSRRAKVDAVIVESPEEVRK
jgi:hypothetical protein